MFRFNFPRPVSSSTFICTPPAEKPDKNKIRESREVLLAVRNALDAYESVNSQEQFLTSDDILSVSWCS